jgi:hypothetical protein
MIRPLVCAFALSGCLEIDLEGEDYDPFSPITSCGEANCSPATPNGIEFSRRPLVTPAFGNGGPLALALGGTDDITLLFGETTNEVNLDYDFLVIDPSVLGVEADGPRMQHFGKRVGTTDLRLFDPVTKQSFQRAPFTVANLASVVPVGVDGEVSSPDLFGSASSFAFAAGTRRVGFALLDPNHTRLVDSSMTLAAPGSTQIEWDTLEMALSVGTHTIAVHAGGRDLMAPIEVVAEAAELSPLAVTGGLACFAALTPAGTFIAGLAWTFQINGQAFAADEFFGPNCVRAQTPYTVTAEAGGRSLEITISN